MLGKVNRLINTVRLVVVLIRTVAHGTVPVEVALVANEMAPGVLLTSFTVEQGGPIITILPLTAFIFFRGTAHGGYLPNHNL